MTRHVVLLRRSTSAGEELSECSSSCSWFVLSSLFVSFFSLVIFFVILCLFIVSYVQMCGQSKRLYFTFQCQVYFLCWGSWLSTKLVLPVRISDIFVITLFCIGDLVGRRHFHPVQPVFLQATLNQLFSGFWEEIYN